MDLHRVAEKAIAKPPLSMKNYDTLVGKGEIGGGIIPHKDGIYLSLSQEAYKGKKERQPLVTGGGESFLYDKTLSTSRTAVYHSPTRLIIAHRGTVPTKKWDIIADLHILADTFTHSARAKSALSIALKAHKKYPKLTMSNTGHSLGGTCAQYVGYRMDLKDSKVVAFNPGSSPFNLAKAFRDWFKCKVFSSTACKKRKNQTLYTTPADPIAFGQLPSTTVIKPEKVNPHSLDNYVPGPQILYPSKIVKK